MILSQSLQVENGKLGHDGHKKIKGVKLGAAVDGFDLLISAFITPVNTSDSRLYFPIIDKVKIRSLHGEVITRPETVIADVGIYTKEIREYDQEWGIKAVIRVNIIDRKKNKSERIIELDKELFKKQSAIERFFSRIEVYKKIYPMSEQRADSYLGLAQMACALIIWEKVLG